MRAEATLQSIVATDPGAATISLTLLPLRAAVFESGMESKCRPPARTPYGQWRRRFLQVSLSLAHCRGRFLPTGRCLRHDGEA